MGNKSTSKILVGDMERDKIFLDLLDILPKFDPKSVSDEAEVSLSTVYKWINGEVWRPHLRTVVRVANALGYEIRLIKKHAALARKGHLRVVK